MEDPNTGAILALVGGRDYNKSQYNRSLNSKRQVGSTMKPILYYTALENGFTAASSFLSERTTFNLSNDVLYSPKNYGELYGNKAISMAAAIALSDNVYAVKTHLFLGAKATIETAYKMGIKTKLEEIASLPLGTQALNIIEITNAYATLANKGIKNEPYLINKVTDMNDNILYEHKDTSEIMLNYDNVYILNNLLSLTYDYDMIDYAYPTNISINALLSNKYAIKSGTTDTDLWIIGYTENAVLGIWTGYDDNTKLDPNAHQYHKDIWIEAMEDYYKTHETSWYETPSNVVGVLVDPISGLPVEDNSTNKKILYYLKGTEPSNNQVVFDEIKE